MFSEPTPKVRVPKRPIRSMFDVSAMEVARQLTLIEFEMFVKIKPTVHTHSSLDSSDYLVT